MDRSEQAHHDLTTHRFRSDVRPIARRFLYVLYGFLAILLLVTWRVYQGDVPDPDEMTSIVLLLVILGGISEGLVYRARTRGPLLVIGPEGIGVPHTKFDTIDWARVTSIEMKTMHAGRGVRLKLLRFGFCEDVLQRPQFGSFRRDRFDLIYETSSILGDSPVLKGGSQRLIDSIERFHPISGK